jgi:hypothetical protein
MNIHHVFKVAGCVALVFATAGLLSAQVDRGAINGTVSDPTGGVVPGVQVTASNVATGLTYRVTTGASGLYSVQNLPIGNYDLQFERAGFRTLRRAGIVLQVSQVAQINVSLQVGSVSEAILVTAETPILQTETTSLGTTMNNKTVSDLPLSVQGGRSVESFAYAVTPNVSGDPWASHIAGSPSFTKQVLIDGTSADAGVVGNLSEMSPSMDAVEEFRVDSTGTRAEAARGAGAMSFTLKSGTNRLHAAAFGFLGNEALNANTWDNNFWGRKRNRNRYNDWGFSGGGPILRNRMFIHGAYEKYGESNYVMGSNNMTVPTAAFLGGDFSALLDRNTILGVDGGGNTIYKGAIFDPLTNNVFAGNIIPANRISKNSQVIINEYKASYAPSLPGIVNNSSFPLKGKPKADQDQVTIKFDYQLTRKDQLAVSYIYFDKPTFQFNQGPFKAGSQDGGPLTPGRIQTVTGNMYRIQETHTFASAVLNTLSLTYNEFNNRGTAVSTLAGKNWNKELGLESPLPHLPLINFGQARNGFTQFPLGRGDAGGYVFNQFIVNDSLTWVRGRHTLKIGGEFRALQANSNWFGPGGIYNFTFSPTTGAPTDTKIQPFVGFGFANFLLGAVQNASMTTGFPLYGRRKEWSLFVANDIKVNSRLTINADLRWDMNSGFKEKNGSMVNFDLNAKNPVFGNIPGTLVWAKDGGTTFETNQYWGNLGPHLGAAFKITEKMVARGGYGIVYMGLGNSSWNGIPYGYAPGFQGINQVNKVSDQKAAFFWDNGYPGKTVYPSVTGQNIPWGPVSYDPDTLKLGFTHNWNVGVQFEISSGSLIDVSYLGNRGRRLHDGSLHQANFPAWSTYQKLLTSGKVNDWVWDQASATAAGVPYPFQGFSGTAYMAINPYPQVAQTWGPIYFVGSPLGKSGYDALTVEYKRQRGNGLTGNLSYTFAKATGNTFQTFDESWTIAPFQDFSLREQEAKYLQPYNQTHVFKGYMLYELPFGRGKRFLSSSGKVADTLLGGWRIGAMISYSSGFPMTAPRSTLSYPGWSALYADVVQGADFKNTFTGLNLAALAAGRPDPNAYFFNKSNFKNPAFGQLGNAPRVFSNWRGWGFPSENFSILKTMGFGSDGRYRVTLRAEFLNVLNRHYWGNPNMDMNSPFFGQVMSVTGARQGQLGARFEF